MANQIVSFVVIACLALTVLLAIFAFRSNQAKKRIAEATSAEVEKWMTEQTYTPDHFAFFHSTAIACKNGENRILLHSNGSTKFVPMAEISASSAYETIERSRPLGAAPGVVELNAIKRFNLDITLKNARTPYKVLLENKALQSEWQDRLSGIIHKQDANQTIA